MSDDRPPNSPDSPEEFLQRVVKLHPMEQNDIDNLRKFLVDENWDMDGLWAEFGDASTSTFVEDDLIGWPDENNHTDIKFDHLDSEALTEAMRAVMHGEDVQDANDIDDNTEKTEKDTPSEQQQPATKEQEEQKKEETKEETKEEAADDDDEENDDRVIEQDVEQFGDYEVPLFLKDFQKIDKTVDKYEGRGAAVGDGTVILNAGLIQIPDAAIIDTDNRFLENINGITYILEYNNIMIQPSRLPYSYITFWREFLDEEEPQYHIIAEDISHNEGPTYDYLMEHPPNDRILPVLEKVVDQLRYPILDSKKDSKYNTSFETEIELFFKQQTPLWYKSKSNSKDDDDDKKLLIQTCVIFKKNTNDQNFNVFELFINFIDIYDRILYDPSEFNLKYNYHKKIEKPSDITGVHNLASTVQTDELLKRHHFAAKLVENDWRALNMTLNHFREDSDSFFSKLDSFNTKITKNDELIDDDVGEYQKIALSFLLFIKAFIHHSHSDFTRIEYSAAGCLHELKPNLERNRHGVTLSFINKSNEAKKAGKDKKDNKKAATSKKKTAAKGKGKKAVKKKQTDKDGKNDKNDGGEEEKKEEEKPPFIKTEIKFDKIREIHKKQAMNWIPGPEFVYEVNTKATVDDNLIFFHNENFPLQIDLVIIPKNKEQCKNYIDYALDEKDIEQFAIIKEEIRYSSLERNNIKPPGENLGVYKQYIKELKHGVDDEERVWKLYRIMVNVFYKVIMAEKNRMVDPLMNEFERRDDRYVMVIDRSKESKDKSIGGMIYIFPPYFYNGDENDQIVHRQKLKPQFVATKDKDKDKKDTKKEDDKGDDEGNDSDSSVVELSKPTTSEAKVEQILERNRFSWISYEYNDITNWYLTDQCLIASKSKEGKYYGLKEFPFVFSAHFHKQRQWHRHPKLRMYQYFNGGGMRFFHKLDDDDDEKGKGKDIEVVDEEKEIDDVDKDVLYDWKQDLVKVWPKYFKDQTSKIDNKFIKQCNVFDDVLDLYKCDAQYFQWDNAVKRQLRYKE